MKTYVPVSSLLIIAILLIQCGEQKKPGEVVTDTVTRQEAEKHEFEQDFTAIDAGKPQFTVDQIFQEQIAAVFEAYLPIRESLIGEHPENVSDNAGKAMQRLNRVDQNLVSGTAREDWMIYRGEILTALDGIRKERKIDAQRLYFSRLSYSLYKAIRAFGLGGTTAYYSFCPSAFNNKGAYWLSLSPESDNPYGREFADCGIMKDTLR